MKSTHIDHTTTFDGETIDYELYPLVTGKERLSIFEEIRSMFSPERAEELLAELEGVKNEFDRELPSIS